VKWSKLTPIVDTLLYFGKKYGKTPTAVALNWVILKGAVPIPTAKDGKQVKDCAEALGWRLSREDEEMLDRVGLVNAWDWKLMRHWQNWWWEQG
jgi:diketogulonate reductase-like aldo/keto reductase